MHLRKLGIRAFRSIVKANLTLGQITVIIGPTDSGKSNVVRALEAWAFNESGGGFITVGRQQCRVAVAVGDDHLVMFEKSVRGKKGAGRYVVKDARLNTSESFEKIGITVPVEVRRVTGIESVVVDDVSVPIQISAQDEDRFLLSRAWTPGKVSKIIGRISGVDALILAQRDLVNNRNSKRKDVKRYTAEVEEASDSLACLGWVSDASRLLKRAQRLDKAATETARKIVDAERAIKSLRDLRAEQTRLSTYHAVLEESVEAITAIDIGSTREALNAAMVLEGNLSTLRSRKEKHERQATEFVELIETLTEQIEEEAEAGDVVCPLCQGPAHDGCLESLAQRARA